MLSLTLNYTCMRVSNIFVLHYLQLQRTHMIVGYNCSHYNKSYLEDSLEILSTAVPVVWIGLAFCILGIINNIVLLAMFYRLKWIKEKETVLFINLTIIDLVTSLFGLTCDIDVLYRVLHGLGNNQKQKMCVLKWAPLDATIVCSEMLALGIAVERFLAKWHPMGYIRLNKKYRWFYVYFVWTLATVQMVVFFATTPNNNCVVICLGHLSYPQNAWYLFVIVFDNSISFAIVIIYVITPIAASLRVRLWLRDVSKTCIILNQEIMVQKQKEFINRLIMMSGIVIICVLFSLVPGMIIMLIINYLSPNQYDLEVLIWNIGHNCLLLNSVLPLYIWFFDSRFRKKFFISVRNVFMIMFSYRNKYIVTK